MKKQENQYDSAGGSQYLTYRVPLDSEQSTEVTRGKDSQTSYRKQEPPMSLGNTSSHHLLSINGN